MSDELSEIHDAWIAGHLFRYENLERVVRGFVHPLVASLSAEGAITGFFFIRYGVGGPHIRLRLRPAEGARDQALQRMERAAHQFLAREPSTRSLDEENIRRGSEATVKKDPHEVDVSVHPDNSFHVMPFRPEVERYGGPGRFERSLDLFTLSSAAVLDHLAALGEVGRSVYLVKAYELLLRQALGFAADEDELSDLLRYGFDWFGQDAPKIAEKGEAVARSMRDPFLQMFLEVLSDIRALFENQEAEHVDSPKALLTMGMRQLSVSLRDADRSTRYRIGASQIHMTASRLGLINPEEVYLSRILSFTFTEARSGAAEDLIGLYGANLGRPVREFIPIALAALSAQGAE